jgi:hypothetical protein
MAHLFTLKAFSLIQDLVLVWRQCRYTHHCRRFSLLFDLLSCRIIKLGTQFDAERERVLMDFVVRRIA